MTKFWAPLLLLLLYWGTRLWQLLSLPIFLDEGTYISRALQVRTGDWTVALADGNVLMPRLLALWLPPATSSAASILYAARWLTVAIDALALLAVFLLARRCFSERAAWLAAGFYLVAPFVYVYDRMALADGPLLALTALGLWLSVRIAGGHSSWRSALWLGIILGLAALVKLSGLLGWAAPVLAILSARDVRAALLLWRRWLLAWGVGALVYAPVLLFGAGQYQVGAKSVLALAPDDVLGQLGRNLSLLAEWLFAYFPGAFGLFILAALIAALVLRRRAALWIVSALLPLVFFVLVSRVWYPRYVLPAVPALLVLAGWLAAALLARTGQLLPARSVRLVVPVLLLALLIVPPMSFEWLIAADPPRAPWPAIERWQYVEDWPAGYGVAQAAGFMRDAAAASPGGIYIMRGDRTSAVLEPLALYLAADPGLLLQSMNLSNDNVPNRLSRMAREKPTYVVLDPPREGFDFHERFPLAVARARFEKPGGQTAILVYEWLP